MADALVAWHDFNVSVVTASAGLLGLLFVALSLHMRTLSLARSAELRSVARTVFLGYVVPLGFGFLALMPQELAAFGVELVVLIAVAVVPFATAARNGLRATGVGYDRRLTVAQFLAGMALIAIAIAAAFAIVGGDERALFVLGGLTVLSLLWGVFNTWELIFRIQRTGDER